MINKDKITSYEIFLARGGRIDIIKRNKDLEVMGAPVEKPKNSLTLTEIER